jgi:arylsulfatase A-like enzyme
MHPQRIPTAPSCASLLLATMVLGCQRRDPPPALPPNIVIFDIDSMRADRLEEPSRAVAPTLHDLADRAAVFDAAYAPSGWTAPSLATLLVGRFPPLQPVSAGERYAWTPTIDDLLTLPQVLGYYGFQTAVFWGGTSQGILSNSDRGFGYSTQWRQERSSSYSDDVVQWLQLAAEPPFFALIHNIDLHRPMPRLGPTPSQEALAAIPRCVERDLGEVARQRSAWQSAEAGVRPITHSYDCGLSYYDGAMASILGAIETAGFSENTVIVVTSNHGELLLEHDVVGHELLYDPVVHVPLLVFDPRDPTPRHVEDPVQLQDLAPTLLAMVGAVIPQQMHGRSLVPLLHGTGPMAPLAELCALTNMGNAAIRRGRFELIRGDDSLGETLSKVTWSGQRRRGAWTELYDLQEDPAEAVDLYRARPDLADELEADLIAWQAQRYVRTEQPVQPIDPALEQALKERGYWEAVAAPNGGA